MWWRNKKGLRFYHGGFESEASSCDGHDVVVLDGSGGVVDKDVVEQGSDVRCVLQPDLTMRAE